MSEPERMIPIAQKLFELLKTEAQKSELHPDSISGLLAALVAIHSLSLASNKEEALIVEDMIHRSAKDSIVEYAPEVPWFHPTQ